MFDFSTYPNCKAETPIFLPEIGTFYNQDIQKAHALIDRLIDLGMVCIKGEILHSDKVALDVDYHVQYYDKSLDKVKNENYRQLIERKVMSFEQYERVFAYPRTRGMQLVFSVYDIEGADFALSIGAKALKVSSSNLVHLPLIKYLAQIKIPTIIDTGKAHFFEIARAVEWFRQAGGKDLLLEHSPAGPPAPATEQYLSMLTILQKTFNCPVGLSDHYAGNEMLLAAIPLGASILEKGVMFSEMDGEQDTSHAMLVDEIPLVMRQLQAIHEATCFGMRPPPVETHAARMGVVSRNGLNAGDKLTLDNVDFAWPALGISVAEWQQIEGRVLNQEVGAQQPIYLSMLE